MSRVQMCEASTPFLHLRFFLGACGLKDTLLYNINMAIFVLLFLTVRGCLSTIVYVRGAVRFQCVVILK